MCECWNCGAEQNISKPPSTTWTARSDYPHLVGEKASGLEPVGTATPKPVRAWTKSRIWERTVQAVLAGGVAAILCRAIGDGQILGIVVPVNTAAPLTACAYWFGSTLLGIENWDVAFRLLDRNNDGRVDRKDLQAIFDDWWEKGESKEPIPAPQSTTDKVQLGFQINRWMSDQTLQRAVILPECPRYVGKEKLRQAARVHEINDGKCNFSKRGCGEPFGDDLAQVQNELERLGYIQRKGKAKNAPRIWSPEGERWLEQF